MIEALLQALINGVIAGTILAVPALGFTAIFAVLNYPNFAIGALATVGAYAGWVGNTALGLPMVAALALAFAATAVAGLVVQWAAVKPLESAGALMMAIASLAAGLVLENALRFGFGNDLRGYDLPLLRDWRFGEFRVGPQQVQNFALALAAMGLLWAFLRYSRTGRAMRAVADNRDLALLRGVDPARVAAVTVAVGAGLAGMGGMLVGLDTSVDPLVGTRLVLSIFAAAVLGGLGSIPGAVAGAIAIGVAEEVAVLAFNPAYRLVVGFVVILAVLTLRPAGLFGARAS
ncbi:branched-chain amino acid ABC transporter permease [Neoroseomonas oryzicola]|uniref:Branched-chain amino acid ABC transporter permease n=1 Tax=Neoroseomonas oryzicola TaxID=535904 RepID=A0A9X9WBL6_9PROT|nr:branched-chain amino acid ABC transporter permease [Neoroseomonas oryzicola]MBR0657726.1 branched-chain amino acid ABC transporter permease [Neoroseomonas oryzicola]NKE18982.1 branched-chain amino acid ABC transporter permease [Neoroseomonas oryzicola]